MKTTILSALLAAFAISPALAAASEQVYLYTLEVRDATESRDGKWEHDLPTMQAAKALKRAQPDACIDMRSQGSYSIGDFLKKGTIAIVMNTAMTGQTRGLLGQNICENSPEWCVITISEKVFPLDTLSLDTYVNTGTIYRSEPGRHPLRRQPMLPRFSAACETGRYADSWNDAASTPEARAYLENLGVDLASVRTLSLSADGEEVYAFGFPRDALSR